MFFFHQSAFAQRRKEQEFALERTRTWARTWVQVSASQLSKKGIASSSEIKNNPGAEWIICNLLERNGLEKEYVPDRKEEASQNEVALSQISKVHFKSSAVKLYFEYCT